MKVNCIFCGHGFALDDSYCDYEGLVRCSTCGNLLECKFEDGMVKGVRPGMLHAPAPQAQAPEVTTQQPASAPNPQDSGEQTRNAA